MHNKTILDHKVVFMVYQFQITIKRIHHVRIPYRIEVNAYTISIQSQTLDLSSVEFDADYKLANYHTNTNMKRDEYLQHASEDYTVNM